MGEAFVLGTKWRGGLGKIFNKQTDHLFQSAYFWVRNNDQLVEKAGLEQTSTMFFF